MRTFLSTYTIRVKKYGNNNQGSRVKYCKIGSFNDHADLYDVILTFLKEIEKGNKNITHKTYIKSINVQHQGRRISGIIESGVYGVASDIRDIETNKTNYKKQRNDADILPFYFLFHLPKDTDEGLLILQRTGKFGIRTSFGNSLDKYFSRQNKGYFVEINTLVKEEIIKKAISEGIIKKLRCVKYDSSSDSFDGLDKGHEETTFDIEYVLSANKIPFLNRIKDFFDNKSDLKKLVEIQDFEYDTVKIEVDTNGRNQIFDLGKLDKSKTSRDISDQITMDSDECPNFESIHKVADNYMNEIISKVYL